MANLEALRSELGGIPVIDEPDRVLERSRDFYWCSPILKHQLESAIADLVVEVRSEEEVIQTLRACYSHGIPVTPRGAGTGTYGQAMPLKRGVVLDLSRMDRIKRIDLAVGRFEAGCKIYQIDKACQEASRQELRVHPSSLQTATIGGFIAGGSSGVGSIGYGLLRERGNILGVRVVTMEAEPRVLELRGDAIEKVNHAFGTNGIITEVEMPLAPAHAWVDLVVGFDTFPDAIRFADDFARQDAITKKLVTVLEAPVGERYFRPLEGRLQPGQSVALLMVAEPWLDDFREVLEGFGGEVLLERAASDPERRALPIYQLSWTSTTLHALQVDPALTYLQVLFPPGANVERALAMDRHFGEEVLSHLEFIRFDGQIACIGLPLVRFTDEARLDEIIRHHEDEGCPVFNPHAFTLEEGGMKRIDHVQLAFKRETDPAGLLNPGKMLGWDDPNHEAMNHQSHLYRSLET